MRLFLSGIIIVIGLNIALAIRDSKMYDKLDQRNNQIEKLLQET